MTYREMTCAAVHDLSGLGKCSLTIILPVLSACGVETSALPTAYLSTHTGGFTGYVYEDLTHVMLPTAEQWKREGAKFNAVYSGFLGSDGQIEIVEKIFDELKGEDTFIFVDPVMGDNGRLYKTYTDRMADGMARLCAKADVIAPNMTEACRVLGIPYEEGPYTKDEIDRLLEKLCKLGPRRVVLTGVYFDGNDVGAAYRDNDTGETGFHMLPKIEGSYHGTGDIFSSTLLGGMLNGMTLSEACKLAVEFTHTVIETTRTECKDRRFGPKFECHLPWLCQKLEEFRNNA